MLFVRCLKIKIRPENMLTPTLLPFRKLEYPMPSATEQWMPARLSKRHLPDLVAESLIRFIQKKCKGGDQLPSELVLSKHLGVSKGPLREALRALEIMGCVVKRNGSGTYVTTQWHDLLAKPIAWGLLDRDKTMAELIEARILIEMPMAELAVDRMDEQDLAELEAHVRVMETMHIREEERYMEADLQFHLLMASGTKNRVLADFMNIAKSILRRDQLHLLGIHTPEQLHTSAAVHRAILEGLRSRDRAAVKAAMEWHSALLRFYLLGESKPG
jgi:GntR family transcriptional repressor for pyruvate dehydrogenase complex